MASIRRSKSPMTRRSAFSRTCRVVTPRRRGQSRGACAPAVSRSMAQRRITARHSGVTSSPAMDGNGAPTACASSSNTNPSMAFTLLELPGMKLKEIKTFVVGNPPPHFGGRYFVFVKLTTDDNICGVGEAYCIPFHPDLVAKMLEDLF